MKRMLSGVGWTAGAVLQFLHPINRSTLLVVLLVMLGGTLHAQPGVFIMPIAGELGHDFHIINHVDHDSAVGGVRDYACGLRSYDGHMGTDIVLRNFRQMDSGVAVLAAASGTVIAVVDTAFDRNKRVDVSLGFGNYVLVSHADSLYSYYAHIRRGSAIVKVGDQVDQGEKIALVGSAGNSTDPHLHFEVYRNNSLIDPFSGACNGGRSYWIAQPAYDTGFGVIDHGVLPFVPTLDTLRERPPSDTNLARPDTAITFWVHQYGVRAGDSSRIEWYMPDGTLWFSYGSRYTEPSRYYYWWSYIDMPDVAGVWRLVYLVNGMQVVEREFSVGTPSSVSPRDRHVAGYMVAASGETITVTIPEGAVPGQSLSVDLYDARGALVAPLSNEVPDSRIVRIPIPRERAVRGLHFVRIVHGGFVATVMLVW